jgi:FSR family fosmidomycin resistance protein-like MFS transporter
MVGFVPLLLVDLHGIRAETAAGLQAIIFSGGFWVAPLAGYLSDRLGKLPLMFVACGIVVPAAFLLPRVPMGAGVYILLVLIGLFMFMRMPVSESLIFAQAPARQRSTLLGVYFLGSNLGGGVFTPLVGWLSDRHGFLYSFTAVALAILILAVVCGVILASLRREGRRAPESPQTA